MEIYSTSLSKPSPVKGWHSSHRCHSNLPVQLYNQDALMGYKPNQNEYLPKAYRWKSILFSFQNQAPRHRHLFLLKCFFANFLCSVSNDQLVQILLIAPDWFSLCCQTYSN